ncbi:MAG: Rieske 2Fe-2S domain-containing protein [Paludibacter sp.]|nr:Rieske 2Fe-2S domain-containing protein [Paludibacter sp.]
MIYNQWYVILESKELKKGKPLLVKRLNEQLSLWRDENGNACCIADKCCHRGVSLSCGQIIDGKLECPFHGFIYDKQGKVISIPANGKNAAVPQSMKVQSYRTFEDYGFIWIWWGDENKTDQDPFFFKE